MDAELLRKLKEWRSELAVREDVPAYAILSDASLQELVNQKPLYPADLKKIEGIGGAKFQLYSSNLLQLIRDYIRTQEHRKNHKGRSYLQSLYLYKQGMTLGEIAHIRTLNTGTIAGHLALMYEQGEDIDISPLVSQSDLAKVRDHWIKSGKPDDLKTVFDQLKGELEYYVVRLGVAWSKRSEVTNNSA